MTVDRTVRDVAVVGASLAGLRAAETLRGMGYENRIHMISDEPHLPYNRPPLSKGVLADGAVVPDVALAGAAAIDAVWHLSDAAVRLDAAGHELTLASGRTVAYDRLLVATGSRPRWPASVAPGPGVLALRTLEDALALRSALRVARRLIVIGAGFVGCEVAASAREGGVDVAVVDRADAPLIRALGAEPASAVERAHRDRGVVMHVGRSVVEAFRHDGMLRGVQLDDGTELEGDVAVVGIGAVPSVEWLEGSGLVLDDGVVCDAQLRAVGVDDVVAAGDVLRWPHPLYGGALTRIGHWTHAAMSGMAAARAVLDPSSAEPFAVLPEFWSDQYSLRIRGVGRTGGTHDVAFVQGGPQDDSFVATYSTAGRVVGVLALNAGRALAPWRRELARSPDGQDLRAVLSAAPTA